MAGHSKWANIKHRKAAQDAKRGKAFTKLIKEITVTARLGGGDPAANPRLRQLLEKARSINMPQDNIARAIKKGTGELPGVNYDEVIYEGYGPGGIAILIEALTDNRNRTVAELRHIFSSKGGNLADKGAVNWMFERRGIMRTDTSITEEDLLESLLDFNVYDISCDTQGCTIVADVKDIDAITDILAPHNKAISSNEIEWISDNLVALDEPTQEKAFVLLEALSDHDDVQNVFTNIA